MNTVDKIVEGNAEHKNSSSSYLSANPLDSFTDVNNASYHLHTSTTSNESDLSLLSLSLDKELGANTGVIDIDELPAFEIRLISPLGRTPSPIDSEDMATPTRPPTGERFITSRCRNNPEFVALHDINAQISPPSDYEDEVESSLSRTSSLETIFEGVLLNTPPRQRLSLQNNPINRSRTNLLEKVALNRLNLGKENQSPLTKSETNPRRSSIDFSYPTDPSTDNKTHNLS